MEAVHLHVPQVLVVDDGSTDATATTAKLAGADVLSLTSNHGKGAALQLGLHRAHALGCGWALLLDGDGQHLPEDIRGFLAARHADQADLVIGNRMAKPTGMPFTRRLTNQVMSATFSRLTGKACPDTQCGFRMVRLSAWKKLDLRCQRFELESEMLLAFLAAGRRVEFIPVQSHYKSEQSKIQPVRDTLRWLRWLWGARGDFATARASLKQASAPTA